MSGLISTRLQAFPDEKTASPINRYRRCGAAPAAGHLSLLAQGLHTGLSHQRNAFRAVQDAGGSVTFQATTLATGCLSMCPSFAQHVWGCHPKHRSDADAEVLGDTPDAAARLARGDDGGGLA